MSSLIPGKVQGTSTLTSSSGGVGGGLEMGCARSVDGDKQARLTAAMCDGGSEMGVKGGHCPGCCSGGRALCTFQRDSVSDTLSPDQFSRADKFFLNSLLGT